MSHEFQVRYWGATGSFTRPLDPAAITEKIVQSVLHLKQRGRLREIDSWPDNQATAARIRRFLREELPRSIGGTFGGNTTCVEIQTPETLLIIDSGSGFRRFGMELCRRWDDDDYQGDRTAHVLLTHAHLDHTYATPFFDPYYDARNHFTIWATQAVHDSLAVVLSPESKWRSVYFPPTYEIMDGVKGFSVIDVTKPFHIGETEITSLPLDHPGGALAFRFRRNGSTFVFASDHELTTKPDQRIVDFAANADLLYVDAQYTEQEYAGEIGLADDPPLARRGWGHGTLEAAVVTAAAANVRQVHIGHHDPKRSDQDLEMLCERGRQLLAEALRERGRPVESCVLEIAYEQLTAEF